METKKASNIKNGRYYLQTYGFRYPTPVGCKKEYEPLRLFRPVEYYNGDESSDEELDAPQPGSGDSAYSSQSDPSGRIEVKLHKRSLWKAFMNIGNEMIVTKPGR